MCLSAVCPADSIADHAEVGRLRYDFQRGFREDMRLFSAVSWEEALSSHAVTSRNDKGALEGGISWSAREWMRIEAGVATEYTSRPAVEDLFEVRLWQAVTLDWPEVRALARWVVHHRFMLEERFQQSAGWTTAFRGRYRIAFTVPINRYTVEPGAFYLPLLGEVFWDVGSDNAETFANKKRLTAGLGYQFSPDWAAELRYVWQESRGTIGGAFTRDDNILELRVKSTIRILDYLKVR